MTFDVNAEQGDIAIYIYFIFPVDMHYSGCSSSLPVHRKLYLDVRRRVAPLF